MSDLVAHLHASADRFASAARACPAADWHRQPAPNVWSVAQVVEHVLKVDQALGRAISGAAVVTPAPADAVVHELAAIRAMVLDRSVSPPAPEPMLPAAAPGSAEELIPQFLAGHTQLATLAESLHDTLPHRYVPHFRFGNLNSVQWLTLLSAHAERHAAQIDEIVAKLAHA